MPADLKPLKFKGYGRLTIDRAAKLIESLTPDEIVILDALAAGVSVSGVPKRLTDDEALFTTYPPGRRGRISSKPEFKKVPGAMPLIRGLMAKNWMRFSTIEPDAPAPFGNFHMTDEAERVWAVKR